MVLWPLKCLMWCILLPRSWLPFVMRLPCYARRATQMFSSSLVHALVWAAGFVCASIKIERNKDIYIYRREKRKKEKKDKDIKGQRSVYMYFFFCICVYVNYSRVRKVSLWRRKSIFHHTRSLHAIHKSLINIFLFLVDYAQRPTMTHAIVMYLPYRASPSCHRYALVWGTLSLPSLARGQHPVSHAPCVWKERQRNERDYIYIYRHRLYYMKC